MAARPGARGVVPVDGLSHVRGSTARPLVDATIPAFLAEVVRRHGGRTAAVFRAARERWTYEQLARRADRFAAGLLSLGLYKGDRIGIWAPNRPEWLIAQFATARIGLILVNVNPAYRAPELEYALNRGGREGAHHRPPAQDLGLSRDAAGGRAGARRLPARAPPGRAPARPSHRDPARPRSGSRLPRLRRGDGPGGRRPALKARRDLRGAPAERSDQHPVHLGDHRGAEGGDPHPPQHRQQRHLLRPHHAPSSPGRRSASPSRSTTASAWSSGTSRPPPTG